MQQFEYEVMRELELRDYFAGQIINGLLSNPKLAQEILKHGGADGGWIERTAWLWADGLIDRRNKDNR